MREAGRKIKPYERFATDAFRKNVRARRFCFVFLSLEKVVGFILHKKRYV